MSFSNATESAIMKAIFLATAWANYLDNAVSSPETNIVFALHIADPGEAGTMSTSEASYTDYARVNVARSGSGFSESGGTVNPAAAITFPAGTGGSGTVTHFSCGKSGGGAAAILMSGTVTPNIVTGNGVTPQLPTTTALSLD